jgi:hypothetical protein
LAIWRIGIQELVELFSGTSSSLSTGIVVIDVQTGARRIVAALSQFSDRQQTCLRGFSDHYKPIEISNGDSSPSLERKKSGVGTADDFGQRTGKDQRRLFLCPRQDRPGEGALYAKKNNSLQKVKTPMTGVA